MKATRQSDRNYWFNFGRRAAALGYSLEWVTSPIKPEKTLIIALLTEGHATELKRGKRRARREPRSKS